MEEDQNTPRNGRYPARGDADFPAERYAHDDEISLYDLWDVLVRRLPVLIGVALIVTVAGAVYAFSQPIEYSFRSQLQLAQAPTVSDEVGQTSPVAAEATVRHLQHEVVPEARDRLSGNSGPVPGVRVGLSGGGASMTLTSIAEASESEPVTRLHQAIIEAFRSYQEDELERAVRTAVRAPRERAELLARQITELETETGRLEEAIAPGDGVRAMVHAQQLGDVRRELREARLQELDARNTVESLRESAELMETISVAARSGSPEGVSRTVIMALSVILGGMLGLFAAFFWEFVSNAGKYRRSQVSSQ